MTWTLRLLTPAQRAFVWVAATQGNRVTIRGYHADMILKESRNGH